MARQDTTGFNQFWDFETSLPDTYWYSDTNELYNLLYSEPARFKRFIEKVAECINTEIHTKNFDVGKLDRYYRPLLQRLKALHSAMALLDELPTDGYGKGDTIPWGPGEDIQPVPLKDVLYNTNIDRGFGDVSSRPIITGIGRLDSTTELWHIYGFGFSGVDSLYVRMGDAFTTFTVNVVSDNELWSLIPTPEIMNGATISVTGPGLDESNLYEIRYPVIYDIIPTVEDGTFPPVTNWVIYGSGFASTGEIKVEGGATILPGDWRDDRIEFVYEFWSQAGVQVLNSESLLSNTYSLPNVQIYEITHDDDRNKLLIYGIGLVDGNNQNSFLMANEDAIEFTVEGDHLITNDFGSWEVSEYRFFSGIYAVWSIPYSFGNGITAVESINRQSYAYNIRGKGFGTNQGTLQLDTGATPSITLWVNDMVQIAGYQLRSTNAIYITTASGVIIPYYLIPIGPKIDHIMRHGSIVVISGINLGNANDPNKTIVIVNGVDLDSSVINPSSDTSIVVPYDIIGSTTAIIEVFDVPTGICSEPHLFESLSINKVLFDGEAYHIIGNNFIIDAENPLKLKYNGIERPNSEWAIIDNNTILWYYYMETYNYLEDYDTISLESNSEAFTWEVKAMRFPGAQDTSMHTLMLIADIDDRIPTGEYVLNLVIEYVTPNPPDLYTWAILPSNGVNHRLIINKRGFSNESTNFTYPKQLRFIWNGVWTAVVSIPGNTGDQLDTTAYLPGLGNIYLYGKNLEGGDTYFQNNRLSYNTVLVDDISIRVSSDKSFISIPAGTTTKLFPFINDGEWAYNNAPDLNTPPPVILRRATFPFYIKWWNHYQNDSINDLIQFEFFSDQTFGPYEDLPTITNNMQQILIEIFPGNIITFPISGFNISVFSNPDRPYLRRLVVEGVISGHLESYGVVPTSTLRVVGELDLFRSNACPLEYGAPITI